MSDMNPILNSPYEAPQLHYATSHDGSLDYGDIRHGRRIFTPDIQPVPARQGAQRGVFEVNDLTGEYRDFLVNLVRSEVGKWRESGYPGTTRVTLELLRFWFANPDRHAVRKLFFAQREALESAVWFNEIDLKSNSLFDLWYVKIVFFCYYMTTFDLFFE
jgi:type III restriction enzyme